MAAKIGERLGTGLYTVREAALYTKLSTRTMDRWVFGKEHGKSVIRPQFDDGTRFVSFLDFVQTLAIREIRLQNKLPLAKFRQAIRLAKEKFDIDYPFAREHTTYLNGDDLVIRPKGVGSDEFVEASGKRRGQRLIPFIEMYLKDLAFGKDGLAEQYQIFLNDDVPIVMKPNIRFGEPILPSGYSALNIWEAIRVEGGFEEAAEVYGIDRSEVETAYKFYANYLGKVAA